MAGFGGGGGALGAPAAPTSGITAGLSSGGDADDAAVDTQGDATEPTAWEPFLDLDRGIPGAADDTTEPAVEYDYDVDSMSDLIQSTIAPQTWDTVGGPGSISFFPYTLDFVFAQTHDVHQQVEALFDRLRRMPSELGTRHGARPATVHRYTSDDPGGADFDTLIDLITSTVGTVTWDDVGGPGSIEADPPRVALVVSQTTEMHDSVSRLLTLLRRSRYEAVRGERPWDAAGGRGTRGPAAAKSALDDLTQPSRLSDLPIPQPSELEAMQVRRVPERARWQWRCTHASAPARVISLHRDGSRVEFKLAESIVRTEGDAAAVAWPGLQLVEHGNYAEVLRRALDAQLPWMPHRSNEELARLFDVCKVPPGTRSDQGRAGPDGQEGSPGDSEAGSRLESRPAAASYRLRGAVWLRLVPTGLPRGGDTYLQIAYSRKDGLPLAWEAYVGGKLTGRIGFAGRIKGGPLAGWRRAILQDPTGTELARWELVASPSDAGEIPPLTQGWDGYVHLDRRADKPAVDRPLAEALAAIRDSDWTKAADQLGRLPEPRARHPLVQLLQAWCLENDRRLGPRDRMLGHLHEAVRGDAADLVRFVAAGGFPSLSRQELYTALLLQPQATRTPEDYDRLAQAAAAIGKQQEALRHVEAALRRDARDGRADDRQRRRVALLLQLDRTQEAVATAADWADQARHDPSQLASMAELLADYAQQEPAERLFRLALTGEQLVDTARYRLLRRWAAIRQGVARVETLVEAAELQPAASPERLACLDLAGAELATAAHAETAGRLAAATKDADLAAELLVRQAELSRDRRLAADLAWKVYQSNRLADARLAWACGLWNGTGHASRTIQACEHVLRAGRPLAAGTAEELAMAYRLAGRVLEARRAATTDEEPAADAARGQPVGLPGQWVGPGGLF
jgi:hypothetical protein